MEKSDSALLSLTKEELVARIRELERNGACKSSSEKRKKAKKERPFDFNKHPKRQIALKVAYYGSKYSGLASSSDSDLDSSIETQVFIALKTLKLIEGPRDSWFYTRCGRTDAGVNAYRQVLSLRVRCKQTDGVGVFPAVAGDITSEAGEPVENRPIGLEEQVDEMDYVLLLNKLLPNDIRILNWSPVSQDFSARFDCTSRTYRYLFPRGNLDIQKMTDAAQRLVGENDYRNFCCFSMSVATWTRAIYRAEIKPLRQYSDETTDKALLEHRMMCLEIQASGFLYHQIRCVMSVLLYVGHGYEEPSIVNSLLDTEQVPARPIYQIASGHPLIFFDAGFSGLEWRCSPQARHELCASLQATWSRQAIQLSYTEGLIDCVNNDIPEDSSQSVKVEDWRLPSIHAGLLPTLLMGKRKPESSLLDLKTVMPFEKRRCLMLTKEDKKRKEKSDAGSGSIDTGSSSIDTGSSAMDTGNGSIDAGNT